MDVTKTLDFSQYLNFQAALAKSPDAFLPLAVTAMMTSVRLIQGGVAEYPPATEANQPGRFSLKTHKPMGYYERGRGSWRPILMKETLEAAAKGKYGKSRGVINASAFQLSLSRVQGYKLRASSEQLGKSWTTRVTQGETSVEGVVGNDTSYGIYAQDKENQSGVLAKYGWDEHTIQAVFEQLQPEIDQIWKDAVVDFVDQIIGL